MTSLLPTCRRGSNSGGPQRAQPPLWSRRLRVSDTLALWSRWDHFTGGSYGVSGDGTAPVRFFIRDGRWWFPHWEKVGLLPFTIVLHKTLPFRGGEGAWNLYTVWGSFEHHWILTQVMSTGPKQPTPCKKGELKQFWQLWQDQNAVSRTHPSQSPCRPDLSRLVAQSYFKRLTIPLRARLLCKHFGVLRWCCILASRTFQEYRGRPAGMGQR